MLALPIARRELLVLSRASATWKSRFGMSVMVFVFGIVLAVTYHYGGQIALTRIMHLAGASLSLCCLFVGVSLTADAIAQEKREGTIGLLLLTNLSPFEIVLGKLIAHSVAGFYTVFCALPVLSMTMIYGGMRFTDVLMYLFSALNVLFFSAALGLFASSLCRDKKKASAVGMLILMVFWMGVPGLALLFPTAGAPLSFTLTPALNVGFQRLIPLPPAWHSFAWTHIWAWAFIGLTVWSLPRWWQEEPPRKRRDLREVWKAISYGTVATRVKLRRKLLDRNAFMWLASRDRLQTAGIWIAVVSLMAVFGFHFVRGTLPPEMGIIVPICLTFVLQITFSAAAGAQLVREYEQGTLEMVLSTPLSAQEVIDGQLAASLRRYRTLFALTFILLWVGIVLVFRKAGPRDWIGLGLLALSSGLVVLQFYCLGWVGMWSAVTAPDPKKAHANAFFHVTMFPLLVFGLIVAAMQFFGWLAGARFSPNPAVLLPMLFILTFGNCIYWLRRAKRELPTQLRLFAFRRYSQTERQTLFGLIGRLLGRWVTQARARQS